MRIPGYSLGKSAVSASAFRGDCTIAVDLAAAKPTPPQPRTATTIVVYWLCEGVPYETRLFVQKELDILGSRNVTPKDFAAVMEVLRAKKFQWRK